MDQEINNLLSPPSCLSPPLVSEPGSGIPPVTLREKVEILEGTARSGGGTGQSGGGQPNLEGGQANLKGGTAASAPPNQKNRACGAFEQCIFRGTGVS